MVTLRVGVDAKSALTLDQSDDAPEPGCGPIHARHLRWCACGATIGDTPIGRFGMSGEDYLQWHDGVEFDAESQTWRGYIEANGSTRKLLTEATFEDKGE